VSSKIHCWVSQLLIVHFHKYLVDNLNVHKNPLCTWTWILYKIDTYVQWRICTLLGPCLHCIFFPKILKSHGSKQLENHVQWDHLQTHSRKENMPKCKKYYYLGMEQLILNSGWKKIIVYIHYMYTCSRSNYTRTKDMKKCFNNVL
jgi:hypothetical protein